MSDPHITILMATYNGAQYLPAQLNSLLAQTHKNWSLVVSNDGSRDSTVPLLLAFDKAHPRHPLHLINGPRQGSSSRNFMSMLTRIHLPEGMVALADQDDVWLPNKLARAVDYLAHCPDNVPAIYASESILTDKKLAYLHQKNAKPSRPSFRNALVQNLFSGHSTVLNATAVDLVRSAGYPRTIAFHDWWLYQLVAGAGGLCMLDPTQTALYRQHGRNVFGASHGVQGGIKRLQHLVCNDYGAWLAGHWQALHEARHHLAPEARALVGELLDQFSQEPRATQFRRLGLHRASAKGTAALWLAARLGWV